MIQEWVCTYLFLGLGDEASVVTTISSSAKSPLHVSLLCWCSLLVRLQCS